ncbi:root hair defective 3 GTP-binding protein-domain-containing protein [Mucor mucedo]|uniref:root hair defective 3 GTP-binding protein-domain-containing protein n=1 Tax=Mucor mucedo TaxID=29922 RepID=UPI0022211646|nr:root hair defective 3 GTP-binding protein-domain-containing protein [Mucor mucedo]KAI7867302.1 root hair defective 3 GTP-binding protein-domain-containing protein [Mucor mucedo]
MTAADQDANSLTPPISKGSISTTSWEKDTEPIPRLQIVDEHQKFTQDLPAYLEKWGLGDAGFKYNVVAVFGSQSTGKSTLLNGLFGTSFDVMDENQRSQTTKVIILNLWEHQVGLYQGANMGLLKTVFEVNLTLFQTQKSKEKTLLLIVIRDHVGSTPLANLARTLQADLEKIWAGLSKVK